MSKYPEDCVLNEDAAPMSPALKSILEKKKMIELNAKPGPNGNTPEQFRSAAKRLYGAKQALHDAIAHVRLDVMHGRNYQHCEEDPQLCQNVDLSTVIELQEAMQKASALAIAIAKASED